MTKYKLEYIWLDGKQPVPGLRGKSLLKAFEHPPTLADLPNWGFDGSSTMQAEGKSSDCVLKPVAQYPDGSRKDAYIVLSEVMHADGTPDINEKKTRGEGPKGKGKSKISPKAFAKPANAPGPPRFLRRRFWEKKK